MKRIVTVSGCLVLGLLCPALAQPTITQNFDGCSRTALVNQCWQFASIDVSEANRIGNSGCSARSSALTNPATDEYTMRTPPIRLSGSPAITFRATTTNQTSNPTLRVSAINLITGVSTDLVLYTASTTTPINMTVRTYQLNTTLPAGDYRIQFAPSGSGGASRIVIDDLVITNVLEVATNAPTCQLSALPVTLAGFRATQETDCRVRLDWETSQEENNLEFVVERSADAEMFQPLGRVAGRGTTRHPQRYSFTDASPLPVNYYRLRQIDFNGKSEQSRLVALVNRCPDSGVSIRYEQARQRIEVQITSEEVDYPLLIQMVDLSGRVQRNVKAAEVRKTVSFDTGPLAGQVVLLKITDARGHLLRTQKLAVPD